MRFTRSICVFLLALAILATGAASSAQVRVGISVSFGPPAIPIYQQPILPGEGYIWVPGYWAYDDNYGDYFWVPGTWVLAPEPGFLWTPGYWAWAGNGFVFYPGYWGPRVGFYGGINYGFGYYGRGYEGGRWENGRFFYNRAVNNINITIIHNVYNTRIINNTDNRISYNGGQGGLDARPTPEEEAAVHERHLPPVADQTRHVQAARDDPELRASRNQGRPPIAATPKPGDLKDRGVVPAKEAGAPYKPPANVGATHGGPPVHVKDLPPEQRPAPPSTGNPKQDQKYQQQQDKLYQKQQQERDKMQQKQDQEHQKMVQKKADQAKMQQLEQKHQQQTQQLQQKHEQQQQQIQQKMKRSTPPPQPPPPSGDKPPRP